MFVTATAISLVAGSIAAATAAACTWHGFAVAALARTVLVCGMMAGLHRRHRLDAGARVALLARRGRELLRADAVAVARNRQRLHRRHRLDAGARVALLARLGRELLRADAVAVACYLQRLRRRQYDLRATPDTASRGSGLSRLRLPPLAVPMPPGVQLVSSPLLPLLAPSS